MKNEEQNKAVSAAFSIIWDRDIDYSNPNPYKLLSFYERMIPHPADVDSVLTKEQVEKQLSIIALYKSKRFWEELQSKRLAEKILKVTPRWNLSQTMTYTLIVKFGEVKFA